MTSPTENPINNAPWRATGARVVPAPAERREPIHPLTTTTEPTADYGSINESQRFDPILGPPVPYDPNFPNGRPLKQDIWDDFFGPPVLKGYGLSSRPSAGLRETDAQTPLLGAAADV